MPFYLRTGKRLPRHVTEIAIQFKRPPYLLFRDADLPGERVPPNVLIMRIQPDEGFALRYRGQGARAGHPPAAGGDGLPLRLAALDELPFSAYETLLLDCMVGDQTLFNRDDQVEEAWRVVNPILEAWYGARRTGHDIYEAGTWGPEAADTLVANDGHAWRRP